MCSSVSWELKPHLLLIIKSSSLSPMLKTLTDVVTWDVCSLFFSTACVLFMFLLCWRSSRSTRITSISVSMSEESCWIWQIPLWTGFGCLSRRFWILFEDLTWFLTSALFQSRCFDTLKDLTYQIRCRICLQTPPLTTVTPPIRWHIRSSHGWWRWSSYWVCLSTCLSSTSSSSGTRKRHGCL